MTVEFLDYTEGSDRHYHDMLGYKMTEWREGYVRLEMDVQPRHRQRGTFTHGGILMGLLDIAGLLSNLYDKRDKVETLTLALSTNFLAAVHSETRGRNWRGDKSRKRRLFCKFQGHRYRHRYGTGDRPGDVPNSSEEKPRVT